eukprot:123083-Ditylum_brightwellii.AAC.1
MYALQQTGVFREALRVWKSKNAANKTWTNFKKDFLDEYSELKEEGHISAQELSFYQANVMEEVTNAID